MVGNDDEGTAFQVLVEPFKSLDNAGTFLLNSGAVLLRLEESSGGKGRSSPSSMTWEMTAPIPYGDSSVFRRTGRLTS